MTYFGDTWHHPAPSHPSRPGAQPWPPYPGVPWEAGPEQRHPQHRNPPAYDPDLRPLRSAYRMLRRVSTLTALGYFTVYMILSCYAEDLMETHVAGDLTLGVLLGLLQLVVTFGAVRWYERSARRSVDRLALGVRERISLQAGEAGVSR
jgi:uncharacterized membrane protein (DUF485 family)